MLKQFSIKLLFIASIISCNNVEASATKQQTKAAANKSHQYQDDDIFFLGDGEALEDYPSSNEESDKKEDNSKVNNPTKPALQRSPSTKILRVTDKLDQKEKDEQEKDYQGQLAYALYGFQKLQKDRQPLIDIMDSLKQ